MKNKKIKKTEAPPNSLLTPFEVEKANNLHKDVLNKIKNILHQKSFNENITNKLKKSTVLCFDDLHLNETEIFIDDKIEECVQILKNEVGNFVDFNPENTKEINMINRFQDPQFVSKFILNKAFVRENTVKSNLLEDNKFIKNSLLKQGLNLNNLNFKDEKALNSLSQLMNKFFKDSSKNYSNFKVENFIHRRHNSLEGKLKTDFFLTNLASKEVNDSQKAGDETPNK